MPRRRTASHSEDWWAMLAPVTAVRCEGHTQDGHQCRREAVTGATVCRQHGGAAPQVRQRAAARIGNAADEMVKRLQAMLDDPQVEARDKIKIAQDLLDRAGLNAVEKHIVGVGELDPVEKLFRGLFDSDDNHGLAPAQPVPTGPRPEVLEWNRNADPQALWDRAEDDVVEAELVEEDLIGEADDGRFHPHPSTVVQTEETMSSAPPAHIARDLERLGLIEPIRGGRR